MSSSKVSASELGVHASVLESNYQLCKVIITQPFDDLDFGTLW